MPRKTGEGASSSDHRVTRLLQRASVGDDRAVAELFPVVYADLRRVAAGRLRAERRGMSLDATELVHEAYLRLVDTQHVNWQNRAHFLAMAARLMRRILVDFARARRYQKRGGGVIQVSFTDALHTPEKAEDLVALDEALCALAKLDERRSRVVELRFFGGLSVEETAAVLRISPETVMRDWKLAKAWLLRELRG